MRRLDIPDNVLALLAAYMGWQEIRKGSDYWCEPTWDRDMPGNTRGSICIGSDADLLLAILERATAIGQGIHVLRALRVATEMAMVNHSSPEYLKAAIDSVIR